MARREGAGNHKQGQRYRRAKGALVLPRELRGSANRKKSAAMLAAAARIALVRRDGAYELTTLLVERLK